MLTEVVCPSCEILIQNPQLSSAGRVRCQNCGFSFRPAQPGGQRTPSPVPTSIAATEPEVPEEPQRKLGPPLQGAQYGMLMLLVWVYLGASVLGDLVGIWEAFQKPLGGAPRIDFPNLKIAIAFSNIARDVLIGLSFFALVRIFTRIDSLTAWLSWRCEGLSRLPSETESGSLPYILPLCVAGGLVMICGLIVWTKGDLLEGDMNAAVWIGAVYLLLLGGVFVATGLGFGDLHRFFRRLSAFGRGIRMRKCGPKVGLGDPLHPSPPQPTHSPVYLLFVTAALCACFVLAIFVARSVSFLSGPLVNDLWNAFLLVMAIAFLAIVGGAYSMYRLALSWRDALEAWEWAAASIPAAHREARRKAGKSRALRGFSLVSYVLVAVQIALTLFLYAVLPLKTPFGLKLLLIGVIAFSVVFLLWITSLREDVHRLRRAFQACLRARPADQTDARLLWGLFGMAALYALLMLGLGVWGIRELYPTLQSKEDYAFPLGFALGSLVLAGYAAMPLFWLALLLRDFTHSATLLETLRESHAGP